MYRRHHCPPPLATLLSVATILCAVVESNPDVGSSNNSKLGFTSISSPMLTRFLSPPETPRSCGLPTMLPLHFSPWETKQSGIAEGLEDGRVRVEDVILGHKKPVFRFIELENVCPLYVMVRVNFPGKRPPRAVRSVVLPLPDGPSIARSSPGGTMPVMPERMVRVGFGPGDENGLSAGLDLILYVTSSNYIDKS
ncbi:hypothetical protein Droror1_Dr00003424 [Drosera rotundifolia]